MDNKTLYHFGIKGMKWGVRKNKKSGYRYESDYDYDDRVQRLKSKIATVKKQYSDAMMRQRQKLVDDGKEEASKLMEISLISDLISSLGNEQATNDACDKIKKSGLFDDFYF